MKKALLIAVAVVAIVTPSIAEAGSSSVRSWAGTNALPGHNWKTMASQWDSGSTLAAARVFDSARNLPSPRALPSDGRLVTLSWDPVTGSVARGTYDSQIRALMASGQPIFLAEQHEIDSALRKHRGGVTLAGWMTDMKHLLALTAHSNVTTCAIITAYHVSMWTTFVKPLIRYGLTCLGMDFDGIAPTGGSYASGTYQRALAMVPMLRAAGIHKFLAPEFGSRLASFDRSGTLRAAWIRSFAARFRAAGFTAIYWWNGGGCGVGSYGLCDGPSKAAWRSVVG
jgi:hypothetical protein